MGAFTGALLSFMPHTIHRPEKSRKIQIPSIETTADPCYLVSHGKAKQAGSCATV